MRLFVVLISTILFMSSCGSILNSHLLENDETSPAKIAIFQRSGGTGFQVLISHENKLASLSFCKGDKVTCLSDQSSNRFEAPFLKSQSEKHLYLVKGTVEFPVETEKHEIHIVIRENEALKILRSFNLISIAGVEPIPPVPDRGEVGAFKLAMPAVYQQGPTNYCWAYASFFTLRTYFAHNNPKDENYVKWKEFVETYDDSSKFSRFMHSTFQNSNGNTYRFVTGLRNVVGLPAAFKWNGDSGGGHLSKIVKNLHQGKPTPFCDGRHCTAIYGYKTDGSSPVSFYIADSSASSKNGLITRSVNSVLQNNFYPFYMNIDGTQNTSMGPIEEVPAGWENRPETFGGFSIRNSFQY